MFIDVIWRDCSCIHQRLSCPGRLDLIVSGKPPLRWVPYNTGTNHIEINKTRFSWSKTFFKPQNCAILNCFSFHHKHLPWSDPEDNPPVKRAVTPMGTASLTRRKTTVAKSASNRCPSGERFSGLGSIIITMHRNRAVNDLMRIDFAVASLRNGFNFGHRSYLAVQIKDDPVLSSKEYCQTDSRITWPSN